MKLTTAEWVEKAEQDFRSAKKLLAPPEPEPSTACFHCQQCLEKYLKARLAEEDLAFPRTHDLRALLALIESREPLWTPWREALKRITVYGVEIRYPGEEATVEEAGEALAQTGAIRRAIRATLNLPTHD